MKHALCQWLSLILLLLLLTACQPTPEKESVKNQQEDYIRSVETLEGFERTDAPEAWTETIVSNSGDLTIQFAAEIVVPEVPTYAIYEMEQRLFSDEYAMDMVKWHYPDAQLIETPVYTKTYWIDQIAAYDEASRKSGKTSPAWLDYAMAAMEEAPDEYTPVPFSIENATDGVQYVARFENPDGTYSSVAGTRNGDDIYYMRDMELSFLGLSAFEPDEESALLADYEGAFAFTEEEGLKTAWEVLEAYGITDVELLSSEKMCTYKYDLLVSKGWDFIFTHRSDGLPAIFDLNGCTYGGTSPLPTLCSPWGGGENRDFR